MDITAKRQSETANELGQIHPHELADMLESGLSPVAIDRLSFTRWRMRETLAERHPALHLAITKPRPVKSTIRRVTQQRST